MKNTKELSVLINAFTNACQVLNIDKKTQTMLGLHHTVVELLDNTGNTPNIKNNDVEALTRLVNFYCALHHICGGDYILMNHWMDVVNKHFEMPPRELLTTTQGLQKLISYIESLDSNNL